MKKLVSLLFICLLITGCDKGYNLIDTNKAIELIENNSAIIIDVREENEFNEGHIKDAINIPLGVIDTINFEKEKNIIVYCATGIRSNEAAKKLASLGYTNVYDLDGGLINWGSELEG